MAIVKKCPKARILSEEIRLVRIDKNHGLFIYTEERGVEVGGWGGGGVDAEKDLIDRIP